MTLSKNLTDVAIFLLAVTAILFMDNIDLGLTLHVVVYLCVASVFLKSWLKPTITSAKKAICMLLYYSFLLIQLTYLILSDFSMTSRLTAALMLAITFGIERLFLYKTEQYCVSPTLEDSMFSFEDLREIKRRLEYKSQRLRRINDAVTLNSLKEMLIDVPRNCSIRYVNKESLSEEYLNNLEKSVDDPYVYLVFSDTGSVASNFIGIVTNKPYNHISISFDPDLKTLVSYNGGERLSPPGLNQEMLEWFYQKEDASIRIYRLAVTREQKELMSEKIKQINLEGSAYNLVGVALRKSLQPNIMVCSEFVYSLLQYAGAEYFDKKPLDTKPSDLIELDYERKLEFVEAIQLSDFYDVLSKNGKPVTELGEKVS